MSMVDPTSMENLMLVQEVRQTMPLAVSQSVRPGRLTASPFRAQALHFTCVACSLAAKI